MRPGFLVTRKRVLNIANTIRPRHRRWIEDLIYHADRFYDMWEKEAGMHKELLDELESTGILKDLHRRRADRMLRSR